MIGEDRLTVEEIIHPDLQDVTLLQPAACLPQGGEDALQYAQRQVALWSGPAYVAPETTPADAIDDTIETWSINLGT